MSAPVPPEPADPVALGARLNEILSVQGQAPLQDDLAARFGAYAALLIRWNLRTNLTAIRDADGILRRHFAESIFCARSLPPGLNTLLDLGSGAGFPGIPIALCCNQIAVTLAESQGKKAAFLNEALRTLGLDARVHGGRAEALAEKFDCVTLRAVDRMEEAVLAAAGRLAERGLLVVGSTSSEQERLKGWAGKSFRWESLRLPGAAERVLLLGRRAAEQEMVFHVEQ